MLGIYDFSGLNIHTKLEIGLVNMLHMIWIMQNIEKSLLLVF